MILTILVALLIYPGLLLALALGFLYAVLTHGRPGAWSGASLRAIAAPPTVEGLANGVSLLCAGVGLALMPWPLHPAAPTDATMWIWAWAAFEGAFLLPLLPALLTGWPPVARAAIREAQIGVVGRMVLWLALAIGLLLPSTWHGIALSTLWTLPAWLLALIAAYFVLPAAVGWGPFATKTMGTTEGVTADLDEHGAALHHTAHTIRTAALLAATLVALLPTALLPDTLPFQIVSVVLLLAAFALVAVVMNRFAGEIPRHTLPHALGICWWRGLPAGLAALMYMSML